ncbi:hypothetical protein M885DRAFT_625578 [Pelagophyceae sp. CCMP2097]|nr:hypothetical protein M885DRAFT_625578 [Pelagophyceae sp. CCMP2097]
MRAWWLLAAAAAAEERRLLNVALHAQSRSSLHGWVAGSEITTRGLGAALLADARVGSVEVFAPFAYRGFEAAPWDLLLTEGYSGTLLQLVRLARRLSPRVVVVHWCLDTFPSLAVVAAVEADAFLTNSRLVERGGFGAAAAALAVPRDARDAWFGVADGRPRAFAALGVDASEMRAPHNASREGDLVVYLGQPSRTKRLLAETLRAVRGVARLEIHGVAWDRFPEYADLAACCWRGPLASGEIAALYARAAVVLGTTEAEQRALRMVNNRPFEALASGGGRFVAVEERADGDAGFSELARVLGAHGDVVHTPAAAAAAVRRCLVEGHDAAAARVHVVTSHSYARRAETVLAFFEVLQRRPRRAAPLAVVVYSAADANTDLEWLFALLPALLHGEAELRVALVDDDGLDDDADGEAAWCAGAAIVVARGPPSSRAVRRVAGLDARAACARDAGNVGMNVRAPPKALLLRAAACRPGDSDNEAMYRQFDVVFHDGRCDDLPGASEGFAEGAAEGPFGPSRFVRALGIDIRAFREASDGWDDGAAPRPPTFERAYVGFDARDGWQPPDSPDAASCIAYTLDAGPEDARRGPCPVVRIRPEALADSLRDARVVHVAPTASRAAALGALASGAAAASSGDLAAFIAATVAAPAAPPLRGLLLDDVAAALRGGLARALGSPRAAAAIAVVEPREGAVFDCQPVDRVAGRAACNVRVTVQLDAFVPPDDGVWCVSIAGSVVGCQGDTSNSLDVHFEYATTGGGESFAGELRAQLRAGLGDIDALPVARESPPVSVRLRQDRR